ncbi:MAG: endonuclease III [Planctomycetota bacterium]|nr:MAG: endonuclease III [Planctomycetota bacterium]
MRRRKTRSAEVLQRLRRQYPDAGTALDWSDPWQLLVSTILSAQCTDTRVNQVTPGLFRRFPTPRSIAESRPGQIEAIIRPTGFFNNKAKSLRGAARAVLERHDGQVPDTMKELLRLPGVARKTANCVLGAAFGKNEGIVVDTHVGRLALRLGLTLSLDPVRTERDLMELFPRSEWTFVAHALILHGRDTCRARKPRCETCLLADVCPRIGVALDAESG